MGLANLSYMDQLMSLLQKRRVDLSGLTTHSFPLSQALQAYELFENHKDKCIKVMLKP
jgi:threonine dehydrogenase-like Zn-dependent dehydrogenase